MKGALYCCYSLNLRRYLYSRGLRYELCAIDPNSKKTFWVYLRNDELDSALSDWSNAKER